MSARIRRKSKRSATSLARQNENGTALDDNVLSAVTKILQANDRLTEQLHIAESKLHEQAEQIKLHAAHALTDSLTGLGNRRAFDFELARRVSEFERHGATFCLLLLDVDHFKKFNDAHGHLAGDEVLRTIGRTLKTAVRTADFVARYGGEEFGIIVPQTAITAALAGAERVRTEVERAECQFDGKNLHVTVSIGLRKWSPLKVPRSWCKRPIKRCTQPSKEAATRCNSSKGSPRRRKRWRFRRSRNPTRNYGQCVATTRGPTRKLDCPIEPHFVKTFTVGWPKPNGMATACRSFC